MIKKIMPSPIRGSVEAISSKSMAHRLMICAALAKEPTKVSYRTTNKDMEATKACLAAMKEGKNLFPCGESGSTLRFLLPIAAALGLDGEFYMEGRLPERPLFPLDEQLISHGASLQKEGRVLHVGGKLTPGAYTLPGDVSSQYISGLLFALPLLDAPSTLTVTGKVESAPYIAMTLDALKKFGVEVKVEGNVYHIPSAPYVGGKEVTVEGDWSNAAFWLCAGAISEEVTVTGLDSHSLQGDKAIVDLLKAFGAKCTEDTVSPAPLHGIEIDASAIPDLVPILCVVAAKAQGETKIYNASRLRLKESDRIESVCRMIASLGGDITATEDGMVIHGGKPLKGGTVDSFGDHRIAMAAAVASSICQEEVTIHGAEAVEKSYPGFWDDFEILTKR